MRLIPLSSSCVIPVLETIRSSGLAKLNFGPYLIAWRVVEQTKPGQILETLWMQ